MSINKYLLIIAFGLVLGGCKKFVTVGAPDNSLNSANVYATDASAIAVLTNLYDNMSSGTIGGMQSITSSSYFAGLSADELTLISTSVTPAAYYYQNDLSSVTAGYEAWADCYPQLYICNAAIEGLTASQSLTQAVKKQLLGEAKFLRALFYYYLVNLYGEVPLATSSNYTVNEHLGRATVVQVYQQIFTDLYQAVGELSPSYVDISVVNGTQERTRPTMWAALALLARCELNNNNWTGADSAASSIIANKALFGIADSLDSVFLKNNREAIWQLQPVTAGQNTQDAQLFVLPSSGPNTYSNPVYINPFLLEDFESGDYRRTHWVDSVSAGGTTYYFPYKYKVNLINQPVSEYEVVLRLGEQYLIRAEAEANGAGTGIPGAIRDLNAIRGRAGLSGYAGSLSPDSVLASIYHERRIELFTEWGCRWIDLKRLGMVDAIMGPACSQKGGTWSSYQQLYPLPLYDIQADNQLTQNPGYE